ncbi:THUMP domain-containing class I SAM-dependent RNA methyltransferase [Litorimonas haliclonae]|uniref:THUMP domain-containing class I SAM-dependent RNA methyltransferase n=1 Tax=Litorimonas haliclonae TaxID=2081977 RepID=UPI0039EE7AC0
MSAAPFEIFLSTSPGLEELLLQEVKEAGFNNPKATAGGITISGDWEDVWRANLSLRGASKVLARIGEFRAFHLAQLDKRARKFPWEDTLTSGSKVKVEVSTNKKSKIYHAGAAEERIERAISEGFGAEIVDSKQDADIVIKTRIDRNNVILSVNTSGQGLHKRGYKQAMGKAPMRETMAALCLRGCGFKGDEPVLDPMCGSGTFLIEAAETSAGLLPGRSRSFAFEKLATYDAERVDKLKAEKPRLDVKHHFYGSDRNVKVIEFANENAARAGVTQHCTFSPMPLTALERPDGPPGLVIVNPPYGARVGKKKDLFALYNSFGQIMQEKFQGWRVGMITSDTNLAQATNLPWLPTDAPINHGGLRVKLFKTRVLK